MAHPRTVAPWPNPLGFGVMALLVLLLGGCAGRPARPVGYYGPTLPITALLAQVNANNQAIPTLFARHYIEADIVDPKTKKSRFVNTGGDLFVHKPRELLLRGKKDVAGEVFQLGSTPERYWMSVFVDEDTMWWGYYRNIGKPCAQDMPIRPDAVGEVLGIGDIGADLLDTPIPTLRFNNDLDVYMLVWNAKLPDRWFAEKEIWYDRATLRPRKVLLFDRDGRVILRANLSEHRQVEVPGKPRENWPWMATRYELYFPETRSTMTMKLSDMALTSRTGQPKAGMIRFPEEPDVAKVIQIDADCKE